MSEFEERLKWLRANDHRNHDDIGGLLTLAEGLAEVIALLRPLVETVTAEQFDQQQAQHPESCPAVHPTSPWPCLLPAGHTGRHRDANEREWFDAPCGAQGPTIDHGAFGVRQYVCQRVRGHDGDHQCGGPTGRTEQWTQRHGDVPPPAPAECGHYGPATDRGAFGGHRPRCVLPVGHMGRHTTEWGVNR